ncbi:MAG: GNAT family N-acetyltransferase [Planctomycetota bacterium]|nr:GNAT family N-acetyltransferase [Planctomycetota bacterium]
MGEYAAYEPGLPASDRIRADVRLATPEDARAIATLYARRHDKALHEVEPQVAGELERIGAGTRAGCVFVAWTRERVVGYGRVRRVVPGVDGQPDELPDGWYLMGVVVDPAWRRRGVASALGRARLAWIAERADAAYCFTNRANRAAIDLHRSLGFEPVELTFAHERAELEAGEGQLFRCTLGTEFRERP